MRDLRTGAEIESRGLERNARDAEMLVTRDKGQHRTATGASCHGRNHHISISIRYCSTTCIWKSKMSCRLRFFSLICFFLSLARVCTSAEPLVAVLPATLGLRGPQSFTTVSNNDTCHAGALCVGPGQLYPLGRVPGVYWSSRFVVPKLPAKYDTTTMTYYDYLNVFWRSNPEGGFMNQFVPQLMLGNALANSTNEPEYKPIWIEMDSWHIGAQYFMALCDGSSGTYDCKNWKPKAATGKLVSVEPGEVVETSFVLKEVKSCCNKTRYEWTLNIGVVGGGPERQSVVIADRPFMGLLNSTFSWGEAIYDNIYVGSCLENYNMQSADSYPPKWKIHVNVKDAPGRDETFWHDWRLEHAPSCSWQPASTISNAIHKKGQHVEWNAELQSHIYELMNSSSAILDSTLQL